MLVMAAGLAAITLVIGHVPIGVVIVLAVLAGFGYPAITGAWSAQLPRLAQPDALTRAYSADAATYSVAAVVAPPLAAALVVVSTRAPLWFAVVLLLAALATLRSVPLAASGTGRPRRSLLNDLRSGLGVMACRVTPVSASPRASTQLMGARPRYFGSRLPCRL